MKTRRPMLALLCGLSLFILGSGSVLGKASASSSTAPSALLFRDRTAELIPGLANGQACWADLDNDGWTDLCASGVAWRNQAGRGFMKRAEGLGAVVAADYDNDGYVDLFSWGTMQLWHNERGRGFRQAALPSLPPCVSRGACWGDFNNDGYVDIFVGGYEDWDKNITYPNFVLMNEAGRRFRLAWTETRFRTRGVTACDFDEDGDVDVYVSNYRLQPNQLLINDGAGHFVDSATDFNAVATSPGFLGGHSIGACWGDFDNDGHFDLFAGNFAHVDYRGDQPKSRFLRNSGPAGQFVFEDRGSCGVFYQESYASPAAADYDNDGDVDIFFTTVYGTASFGRKNYPVLFRNDGRFNFNDATAAAGLQQLPPTYQAAWADYDNDGDLDLVAAGRLFENLGTNSHWLLIQLRGDGKRINAAAIGAQARVKLRFRTLSRHVEAGTGEGNQNDLRLHFGLNNLTAPVTVEICWPGGKKQILPHVHPNQWLHISYPG